MIFQTGYKTLYPPQVSIQFPQPLPTTVFYNETVSTPMIVIYRNLWVYKTWYKPAHVNLENALIPNNPCAPISGDKMAYWLGTCFMSVLITGATMGTIDGRIQYRIQGEHHSLKLKHHALMGNSFGDLAYFIKLH